MDRTKFIITVLEEDSDVDIDHTVGINNSTNEPMHPTVLAEAQKDLSP